MNVRFLDMDSTFNKTAPDAVAQLRVTFDVAKFINTTLLVHDILKNVSISDAIVNISENKVWLS